MGPSIITKRNAAFQQWQAMATNRTKRHRSGAFLVQGVRPITLAVERGWTVRTLLSPLDRRLSSWATGILDRAGGERVAMAPDLLAELGGREGDDSDESRTPELVAVVEQRPDDLARVPLGTGSLVVVFDRPGSPGNVGALIRSADAFGASGVVVTGHSADIYDPKAVRSSTGSLFAVPVVRAPGHTEVLDWVAAAPEPVAVVGTDEHGGVTITDHDLTVATVVVIGNETRGLSTAWRDACDQLISIPIGGAASSLNAANAATVVLYEAARQRRGPRAGPG